MSETKSKFKKDLDYAKNFWRKLSLKEIGLDVELDLYFKREVPITYLNDEPHQDWYLCTVEIYQDGEKIGQLREKERWFA